MSKHGITTVLAIVAAALLAAGCRKGTGGKTKTTRSREKAGRQHQRPLRGDFRVLQRDTRPANAQGEVGKLLADLAGGDMRLAWRAEEALGDMGPWVAPQVRSMLGSASPEARAAACRLAFRFGDTGAIPAMMKLLSDESEMVRAEAGVQLCGLTGQDFGYRPKALLPDRVEAIGRWQAWYSKTHGAVTGRKRRRRR